MDANELRQKLHPELNRKKSFKEKLLMHSTLIKLTAGFITIVAIFVAIAIIQTPQEVEGTPKACVKDNICLDLIIMTTPEELEIGLSNYTKLSEGTGMLFIFSKQDVQRMWMKDMDFPIDMFWISSKDRIVHIEKSAPPCKSSLCNIYEPSTISKYVLETNAGFAKEYNLYEGNKIEFKNIPDI